MAAPRMSARRINIQWERFDDIEISEQVTGGTQKYFRTVAVSRPWRDLKGSAAPGLPGRRQG